VLKQFYRYIGKTKPVAEITYKNIEQGFIPHLKEKGRSNAGINFSLRHLKIWFNWMYDREKIIPERIKFKMLPEDILPCYINEKEMNDVQGEVDDFTGRCLYFYQSVGCRAKEPFKGFIEGNYLKIPPEETKGKKHWRFIHLYSDELKYILMEMRDWRDGYIEEGREYDNAIHRCYEVLRQRLDKAKKKLGIGTNRKITLKSYRHAYGIVRVHMTGNIQGVAIEMGHSNLSTTQKYLNIPPDMVADDFPSVKQYLKLNEPKMGNKVTDCRVTPISLGAHV
jgi:integrase